MSTPRRGLDLPIIPATEFVPGPVSLHARSAEWGVSVRTFNGDRYQTDAISPEDITIEGKPMEWRPAGNGTGVRYGVAAGLFGIPVAVARAVPLS